MADHEVKFKKERETKRTVRFEEVEEKGKPPAIGTLYVQKHICGEAQEVSLTLHVPE